MNFCSLILSSLPGRTLQPDLLLEENKTTTIGLNQVWGILDAGPRMETWQLLWATNSSAPFPAENVPLSVQPELPTLWLLPFVISIASGGKNLALISRFQCQSSPANLFFPVSHSISSSFHTPPPEIPGGCDTAEGGDPVPTAKLMWVINKE